MPTHTKSAKSNEQIAVIGIDSASGEAFDLDQADPAIRNGLKSATKDAQQLMAWKLPSLAPCTSAIAPASKSPAFLLAAQLIRFGLVPAVIPRLGFSKQVIS